MTLELPDGVSIRFFLDRKGAHPELGTIIFWANAPKKFTGAHLVEYLSTHRVMKKDMVAQIYVKALGGYVRLTDRLMFDTTEKKDITVRLTSLEEDEVAPSAASVTPIANTGPAGLFAFAFITVFSNLKEYVEPEWGITFACYAIFHGGLVQLLVGMWEVRRNNIFGATAFTSFGAFWMANGLIDILKITVEGVPKGDIREGEMLRNFMTAGMAAALVGVSPRMNQSLQLILIVLTIYLICDGSSGFNDELRHVTHAIGTILGLMAFYQATAELTNEIYHEEIIPIGNFGDDNFGAFASPGVPNKMIMSAKHMRKDCIEHDGDVNQEKKLLVAKSS